MISRGLLVGIVVGACVLLAILYAFKDKIPILKHLPEITCGFCCGFGFLPADYMEREPRRPQHEVDEEAPAVPLQPNQNAQVVTDAPVAYVQQQPPPAKATVVGT